jgi:hypothetical protein
MFKRFSLIGASRLAWSRRAHRMMQVCAVALSHIDVSAKGRIVRTESASGTTGYVLQLSLPYPVEGGDKLALQAYLRRNIEAVMGLDLDEREFLLQLEDLSATLPMPAHRISTDWLSRRMQAARQATMERIQHETAEAEKTLRAKVVPLVRGVLPDPQRPHWPTKLTGSEFMSLEPGSAGSGGGDAGYAELEPPSRPSRSSPRKLFGRVGVINVDSLGMHSEGLFPATDILERTAR